MKVEVRADNTVHIRGYVNVTGRDSRPLRDAQGIFIEQVQPGTFRKALSAETPVELRFDHKRVIGSTSDGVLTLSEDSIGLKADATVNDAELAEKARKKELRGWSFGFIKKKDRWDGENPRRRYLEDVELREVSVLDVTPAYIATSIETRGESSDLVEYRMDIGEEDTEYRIDEPDDPEPVPTPGQEERLNEEEEIRMQLARQTASFFKLKGERYNA